jgi:hypothetical protein
LAHTVEQHPKSCPLLSQAPPRGLPQLPGLQQIKRPSHEAQQISLFSPQHMPPMPSPQQQVVPQQPFSGGQQVSPQQA